MLFNNPLFQCETASGMALTRVSLIDEGKPLNGT